ncbi:MULTISPECIES: CPBP family intramembrane glutamic endopeptidase [Halococcus]|uniref:CPBP family intramembrane glutamic endopeptidase n=1 Tax=Halococcus TaxID=2249 RepID=UPI000A986BF0|nr:MULTISPECIES: CPBP family intramembrane glutamic endopeptidase [Halococcus]
MSAPDSTWFLTPALTTDPVAWVVVFVWWFLITAPAEELLFRGIIQGRLKSSFSVITAVVLAAGLFAGMHVGFALYRGYGGNFLGLAAVMFATGLLFGSVYERTGNLVVPSFAHALFWLSPALLAYL